MKTKEYKVENAPLGTRFIHGGHSTPLIVTDGKETSNASKSVVCVSESGLIRKIPYGTKILAITGADKVITSLARKIMNDAMSDVLLKKKK